MGFGVGFLVQSRQGDLTNGLGEVLGDGLMIFFMIFRGVWVPLFDVFRMDLFW